MKKLFLIFVLLLFPVFCFAADVTLQWDANTESDLAGYYVYQAERIGHNMKAKPDPRWSDFPICVRYILQEVGMKYRPREQRKEWPLTSYEDIKPKRTIIDLGRWV